MLTVAKGVSVVLATHTLLVHVWFAAQVPQVNVPPQPSAIEPQFFPCAAQVVCVHAETHWLPLHVFPLPQVGQVSVPPQPSDIEPQLFCGHVPGTHDPED